MGLSTTTSRNFVLFFSLYAACALLAFWPSYLSNPARAPTLHWHVHGVVMGAWLAMLVTQAYLARTSRLALHRQIGRGSYVLAPAVAVSILTIVHYSFGNGADFSANLLAQLGIQLSNIPVFLIAYALAIRNRRDPSVHARYMLCTVLPMTGPIFSRVLAFYVIDPFEWLWIYPLVGLDVLLISLSAWDLASRRRLCAFPIMLGIIAAQQAWSFAVYRTESWRSFAQWFAGA